MSFLVLLLNLFFVVYYWKQSDLYFKDKKSFAGFICIFVSAINAVAIAMVITRT